MAAALSTLRLKFYFHSSRFIRSIVDRRLPSPTGNLREQASGHLITDRPAAAPFTTHLKPPPWPQSNAFNWRPFVSSSASSQRPSPSLKQQPQSISGEDWENLSPEAKIEWLGEDKWGWVVYRCSYAKEFDGAWEDLKRRVQKRIRDSIAKSDAPGVGATMDFRFIEAPALEDAPVEELQRRFQAWAREDNAAGFNVDYVPQSSRHGFFLRVDGEALWNGYVSLVRAWPESPGSEDWMKIRASAVGPEIYVELDNPEVWYAYYTPPESGVCSGW